MFDLGPAARELTRVVEAVRDDQLDDPTPCEDWQVRQLLAHVLQFATVFTNNAHKVDAVPPSDLPDDWRTTIPAQLDALVEAWRDEDAWVGRVSAGGVEMSGEENAVVAVEELVLHGWDLAGATRQPFTADDESLAVVERFLEMFGGAPAGQGPHGPAVAVPEDADRLDRVLGAAGREPGWATSGR